MKDLSRYERSFMRRKKNLSSYEKLKLEGYSEKVLKQIKSVPYVYSLGNWMKKMFIGLFLEDANAKICLIAIYFEDIGII